MSKPEVIKTIEYNGRSVEIVRDCDWTYLARYEGETALFGICKADIDQPAEPCFIAQTLFEVRNKTETPPLPEINRP